MNFLITNMGRCGTAIVLPYRGEFGFICMEHAPQVNAVEGRKIVCLEAGNEALYPGAAVYHHVARRPDGQRRARNESQYMDEIKAEVSSAMPECSKSGVEWIVHDGSAPRKYFIPRPHTPVDVGQVDVVICPRRRTYGSDKNWPYWQELNDKLRGDGLKVYAAGAPDSSFDVRTNAGRSWDHGRFLDATIAAMHAAELVIATDAGLAHLAVMCGKPLVMITHGEGLVAPGQDDVGNDYWPVHMDRYERENHCGSDIELVHHAFADWRGVADRAIRSFCPRPAGAAPAAMTAAPAAMTAVPAGMTAVPAAMTAVPAAMTEAV